MLCVASIRPLRAVMALAALAACSQPPGVADPVEGVPLAQQRTITRNEVGYKWPFEMGTGTIACDGGALFFRAGGTTYGLATDLADVAPGEPDLCAKRCDEGIVEVVVPVRNVKPSGAMLRSPVYSASTSGPL